MLKIQWAVYVESFLDKPTIKSQIITLVNRFTAAFGVIPLYKFCHLCYNLT
jgi:hypothetical protein